MCMFINVRGPVHNFAHALVLFLPLFCIFLLCSVYYMYLSCVYVKTVCTFLNIFTLTPVFFPTASTKN